LPFIAGVQVTCIETGDQIAAPTEDLTRSGCFVETATPFADGTKLALRVLHNRAIVIALGEVAYSLVGNGMGIRFTAIEPSSVSILDAWLAEVNE
jgi:hypothetical protein